SDDANGVARSIPKRFKREAHKLRRACRRFEDKFYASSAAVALSDQLQQFAALPGREMVYQLRANKLFDGKLQNFGETGVGVENVTRSVQCCRALIDRLDQHAVRKFGALQGDNPVATGALHHQGVNAAAPDSLDDLPGF